MYFQIHLATTPSHRHPPPPPPPPIPSSAVICVMQISSALKFHSIFGTMVYYTVAVHVHPVPNSSFPISLLSFTVSSASAYLSSGKYQRYECFHEEKFLFCAKSMNTEQILRKHQNVCRFSALVFFMLPPSPRHICLCIYARNSRPFLRSSLEKISLRAHANRYTFLAFCSVA